MTFKYLLLSQESSLSELHEVSTSIPLIKKKLSELMDKFGIFSNKKTKDKLSNITKIKIQQKIREIDVFLSKKSIKSEKYILAAYEDFYDSTSPHACFDLKTVYQMMGNDFKKLSKKYPNVLLAPGSFYVSHPIPSTHHKRYFSQDNVSRKSLATTTCYVTNICPILYNGEIICIIRKGEKITLNHKEIDDIDLLPTIHEEGKLKVLSYHEDNLTDLAANGKTSCCYLGKTLLPNEKQLIKIWLGIDFSKEKNLFRHEFEIEDKKFLSLICGEFNFNKSTTAELLRKNKYDYVMHLTEGGDIPDELMTHHGVYIHADKGNQTKIIENMESLSLFSKPM